MLYFFSEVKYNKDILIQIRKERSKMKKVLALALIVALSVVAVFGLAACNNKEDWEYIEKKGEMVIGYTVFNPMNYEEDGELVGFDTELAKAVCEELGVEAKFQVIDWNSKFTELNSKNIDAIWNGFTVTQKRRYSTDFTYSYLKNKQIAVVKAENAAIYTTIASMADAKLVAEEGSAGESAIQADATLKNADYTAIGTQTNALLEVKAGTSDIAFVDSVMAEGTLAAGGDYSGLVIVEGISLVEEEYAIGLRRGSSKTLEKIDIALKALYADGTIAALAAKYNLTESLLPIA